MIFKCDKCDRIENYAIGSIINENCSHCSDGKLFRVEENKNLNILDKAFKTINGDRQDSYGAPEDSFQIIASFWTTYLGHKDMITEGSLGLSALDVAHMMTLFKIARMLGQKPKQDNYVDAIGYLAIAADRLIRWPEPFDPEEL